MMAEAAVHSVDGGGVRSHVSDRMVRYGCGPVHIVGSCSHARGRNSGRAVGVEENRMSSYVGRSVPIPLRGSWSLLVRRLSDHRPQAAARYTAAGVRYPSA